MQNNEVNFQHFIITRYNVKLEGWETDIKGKSTLDRTWTDHRFQLFVKYCLPSIVNQTDKNFQWLIYIDDNTNAESFDQLNAVIKQYPALVLKKVAGYDECMRDIDMELTNAPSEYVITTRLDNDDGLGLDYIRMVHTCFIPEDKLLLNFLHGHGYDWDRKILVRLRNIRKNHFSSLIERKRIDGGHLSVRGFPHDDPPENVKIKNIPSEFSWIKIFHHRNLKSTLFGYPVFFNNPYLSYGIERADLSMNTHQTLIYFFPWLVHGIKRRWQRSVNSWRI